MSFILKSIQLGPKLAGYGLSKYGIIKAPMPMNFTFSVTHACQSLCKTCNIGLMHRKHPERVKNELTLEEIEKVFKSIGKVYFFNISGGEPFLRQDLPEIVRLSLRYMKPGIVHTPTNALMPSVIEKQTRKIMEIIKAESPSTHFTIKPSFDAVGKKHDYIRGVKGNWEKLNETLERLKSLKKEYPNLYVGVGTVISKFSISSLPETIEQAKKFGVDSYISEVAEKRSEMTNRNEDITPSCDEYQKAISLFKEETRKEMKKKPLLSRIAMSMRIVYYDLCTRILKENRQVIPCYGGITNAHMNAYGDIWPCAILAYDKSMGNVRDYNYDFKRLWRSNKANEVRRFIHEQKCACPLANQSYSNIIMHPPSLIRGIKIMIFG